ncbi:hypothetical protein Tco_1002737 [Tanacetum coccineum]|uniref:Uncharacterized protein n=1 Tax=Tanacetum coccineum TaxID=301880 RepID=A0ABQ5F7Q5_9ASTR
MSAKGSIATQTCELSKEEFNDFLTLYPIPFEYRVILPKSNQTVFDAPPGFIYLGLTLLVVPSSPLLLSCARLMVVSPLSTSSEGSSICVKLRLGQYPTSVRVFPDPILFLAGLKSSWEHGQQRPTIMTGGKGIYLSCFFLHFPFSLIYDLLFLLAKMAFRNFIYIEDDEELSFLPKEPSPSFGTGSPSVSFNTEPLKADEELGGSSRPPIKRKLAPGSSTSRAIRAMTYSLKDDVPYLIVSDDDKGLPDVLELKDATACHLKISAITPPA